MLGKYLQATLDLVDVFGVDKKVLNSFISAVDRKDLPGAKAGLVRAARRLGVESGDTVDDILGYLPALASVDRPLKRAKRDSGCYACGAADHIRAQCPRILALPSARPVAPCPYCRKPGHLETSCWTKFPHLRPRPANGVSSSSSSAASQ